MFHMVLHDVCLTGIRVPTVCIGCVCVFAVALGKKLLLEWKFVEKTDQHPAFSTLVNLSSVMEGLSAEVGRIHYEWVLELYV